jgi:hypothetical protein
MAGCKTASEDEIETLAVAEEPVLLCGPDGHLSAALYGVIETQIDWGRYDVECTGMPRPEGRGVRLRFAGLAGDGQPVAFIIAIPDFDRDTGRGEFGSNVTLIEEGAGRFFSTPDLNNCLAEIVAVEALDDTGDRFSVSGALYCVAPLPEINGNSAVSTPELQFTGLIDWSAS